MQPAVTNSLDRYRLTMTPTRDGNGIAWLPNTADESSDAGEQRSTIADLWDDLARISRTGPEFASLSQRSASRSGRATASEAVSEAVVIDFAAARARRR
jgi:hypothetical protein